MKTKLIVLSIFLFLIGAGLGSWGYTAFLNSRIQNKSVDTEVKAQERPVDFVESDQNVIDLASESYNIVFLGHGGEGHQGGSLKDSIILVHVESKAKRVVLISIPRDLWFSGHKLNADPSIKDAVAGITGLSVDDYISIDFDSFVATIDGLGGIEINIPKSYTDNFYPVRGLENELCGFSTEKVADLHVKYSGFQLEKQFECRYESIHFDVGVTTIDGETALKYVRSRHGDGDFGRSERQFFLLKGLITKNISIDTITGLLKIVKTNLTVSKIKTLVNMFVSPLDYEIKTVHLSDANVLTASKSSAGAYILVPNAGIGNFEEIKKFITK